MRVLTKWFGWASLALLLGAGVVHASAPPIQYDLFTAADTEIEDRWTELIWERRPPIDAMSYQDAVAHCAPGARLPTVKELLTLVDEQGYGSYENGAIVHRVIDRNAFPNTAPSYFWTLTEHFDQPNQVWVVHFGDGQTTRLATNEPATIKAYVRCVRNAP